MKLSSLNCLRLFGVATFFVFFASCSSTESIKKQLVSKVDVNRFMGRWYVISHLPLWVEENSYNATETYSMKDDKIKVDYRHLEGSFSGEEKTYPQKGWVVKDDPSGAHWKVQFFWPLSFDYLIVGLDEKDYQYTIVGVPNKNYAWIMSRKPTLDEKIYEMLVNRLKELGYETERLRKVPQKWD